MQQVLCGRAAGPGGWFNIRPINIKVHLAQIGTAYFRDGILFGRLNLSKCGWFFKYTALLVIQYFFFSVFMVFSFIHHRSCISPAEAQKYNATGSLK
jgi:hypothetical protein